MDTTKKLNQIEMLTRIVESIKFYQNMIEHVKRSRTGSLNYFPDLIRKAEHRIEIYEMCIARLNQRFNRLKSEL